MAKEKVFWICSHCDVVYPHLLNMLPEDRKRLEEGNRPCGICGRGVLEKWVAKKAES